MTRPVGSGLLRSVRGGPAVREVIPREPGTSFRWRTHSYPDPLARWNTHPEFEIHLIRKGTGRYIIGDAVGLFGPGSLFLVGSNLPHDWVSDIQPGEVIDDRDVVLQFDPQWLGQLQRLVPELEDVSELLHHAKRGIEFLGTTAREGAANLEEVGSRSGAAAVAAFMDLLAVLSGAPAPERQILSSTPVAPNYSADPTDVIASAIDYIFANIAEAPRLSVAADLAGMSESAFSRFFKAASGQTFSDMVRRLRLAQACRLLEHSDEPISQIAHAVGYSNLSNFNRRFREEYGVTPSAYRKSHLRGALTVSLASLTGGVCEASTPTAGGSVSAPTDV